MRDPERRGGRRPRGLQRTTTPLLTNLLRTLIMVLISAFPIGSAQADPSRPKIAVLPVKLLDTSAEPADQRSEHDDRLKALASGLSSELNSAGAYQTVNVTAEELHKRCPTETSECILETAQSEDADLLFIGVVHKSSSLIMQMWARIVDAKTGGVLFSRELSFRGDTDTSWQRAQEFLVTQIRSDPPEAPR